MASRQASKQDMYFLVRYDVDQELQVRSRGFFKTEDLVKIGEKYSVQWGRPKQFDTAVFLASGTLTDIRNMMATNCPATPQPTPKRKRKTLPKKNVSVKTARQLDFDVPPAQTGTSHIIHTLNTLASSTSPSAQVTFAPASTSTTAASRASINLTTAQVTPASTNEVTNAPVNTSLSHITLVQTSTTVFCKVATSNRRTVEFESKINTLEAKLDATLIQAERTPHDENDSDVSMPTLLCEEEVKVIYGDSRTASHFAVKFLPRIFPELFWPTNLRMLYNWHGNGQGKKSELDANRKSILQAYVNAYFPETKSQNVWNSVVLRINERLRRKDKQQKAQEDSPFSNLLGSFLRQNVCDQSPDFTVYN